MSLDYAALRNEILTDPAGLGYAPTTDTTRDVPIAEILNQISTQFSVSKGVLSAYLIVNEIAWTDASTGSTVALDAVRTIIGAGHVDPGNTRVRAAFATVFPSTSATRQRLIDVATQPGSRGEVLFGLGIVVEPVHVGLALRSA